jgi:hypothetical protein
LKTFSGRNASQHPAELKAFLQLAAGVQTYLEIGARDGDTLVEIGRVAAPGALLVAVDLPGGAWGRAKSKANLEQAQSYLLGLGLQVHVLFGDSQSPAIIDRVAQFAPFELGLIDGDHRYAGVAADAANYGPMCKKIAFHDIVGHGIVEKRDGLPVEVPLFWEEQKRKHSKYQEFIGKGSTMGIGVLL